MRATNKGATAMQLMNKHKKYRYHYVVLAYKKDEIIEKILIHLKKLSGGTYSSILRNALFSYYNFILANLKKLNSEGEE